MTDQSEKKFHIAAHTHARRLTDPVLMIKYYSYLFDAMGQICVVIVVGNKKSRKFVAHKKELFG